MSLTNLIVLLLFANSLAHIISFLELNKTKAPNRWGVLAYVFILAALGILILQNTTWAVYPALVFPLIGMIVLGTEVFKNRGGSWIDYVILALDVLTIGILIPLLLNMA